MEKDLELIQHVEQAPVELQTKVAKAYLREDIENEQVQYAFEKEDEFLKACQEDPNIEVYEHKEIDGIGATYSPRYIAPSISDKNWIKNTKGGYNYCIEISNGSCLPNCVGYSWGRWRELLGAYHNLSRSNAENWWANTGDGYQRGQTPKKGAVMCWRKGQAGNSSDGAGHVCIVEDVLSNGTVKTSESAYGGTRFFTMTRKPPYYVGSTYAFQGFIYIPIDFDGTPVSPEPTPTPGPVGKFNIGDKVTINGALYPSSNAAAASGKISNKVTNITRRNDGSAHPYNTTGDLGWMDESAIVKYIEPAPKPTPAPQPTELKVGDKVKIIGTGNGSSYGTSNTAYGIGWTREILGVYSGRKCPYRVGNSTGTTGFYPASSLQKK